jgi:hypothetical protein
MIQKLNEDFFSVNAVLSLRVWFLNPAPKFFGNAVSGVVDPDSDPGARKLTKINMTSLNQDLDLDPHGSEIGLAPWIGNRNRIRIRN